MDFTKMTIQDFLNGHETLWSWLADNPDKDKEDWPGWVEYTIDGADDHDQVVSFIEDYSHCFACIFKALMVRGGRCQSSCLLVFGEPDYYEISRYGEEAVTVGCSHYRSPYDRWCGCSGDSKRKLAERTADLSVNPKYQDMLSYVPYSSGCYDFSEEYDITVP